MSTQVPLVSVITPTFNRASLLAEAIRSIQAQTFQEYEHIIVDDGSQDGTAEMVASFSDPRIVFLQQAQKGVAGARNYALARARGRFYVFLDSDDLALPGRLQNQLDVFASDPQAGLVYGVYYGERSPGARRIKISRCKDAPPPVLEELLLKTVFHWSTVALRASWIERVGNFDEQLRIGEEWDLTLRLSLAGCRMVCFPEPLSLVRMQEHSLSSRMHEHLESSLRVLEKAFSHPALPEGLRGMWNTAYVVQLLRAATVAFLNGQAESGREFFCRALSYDAALLDAHADITAGGILNVVIGFSRADPKKSLQTILAGLSPLDLDMDRLANRLRVRYPIWEAFAAHDAREPSLVRRKVWEALRIEPLALLKNRGLLSIFFGSFFSRPEPTNGTTG